MRRPDCFDIFIQLFSLGRRLLHKSVLIQKMLPKEAANRFLRNHKTGRDRLFGHPCCKECDPGFRNIGISPAEFCGRGADFGVPILESVSEDSERPDYQYCGLARGLDTANKMPKLISIVCMSFSGMAHCKVLWTAPVQDNDTRVSTYTTSLTMSTLVRFHLPLALSRSFSSSTPHSSRACLLAHAMDACLNLSSLVHQ
jgi:hypothetical protein